MAKKVSVTPLHDRVIVKADAAEEKSSGGIIIPDTAKEKPQRGTVIAAGPGKKDEPVTVKVGDTVLYGKYAGTEIQIEGQDYLIMRESQIFWQLCKQVKFISQNHNYLKFIKLKLIKNGKTNLLRY